MRKEDDGDVLAGKSLADADDSTIEARLRELEERHVTCWISVPIDPEIGFR